eukprot:6195769-Pleurochrysis_carterae.AAC.1
MIPRFLNLTRSERPACPCGRQLVFPYVRLPIPPNSNAPGTLVGVHLPSDAFRAACVPRSGFEGRFARIRLTLSSFAP